MKPFRFADPCGSKSRVAWLGFASAITFTQPAAALEFALADGDITGTLDNTVSFGQVWRVQGQAKNNDALNGNDGNRNFDTGLVSQVFKLTSELEAKYQNYGLFVRGSAFYDTQIMDKRSDYYNNPAVVEPSQNYPKDDSFTRSTRHLAGRSADILDAYVYGAWDVADHPLTVRFGRQVFNWGESLFYRGVSVSNPVDAVKYRLPGSQVKEVLVPVEALSLNFGLTDNLSMDAYYQLKWKETALDPVGSYYSTTDIFGPGGNTAYAQVPALVPAMAAYGMATQIPGGLGQGPFNASRYLDPATGIFKVSNVQSDDKARASGQYGISLHYIAEALNATDFGFYFANYHAKEPVQQIDTGAYRGVDLTTLDSLIGPSAARALATLDLSQNANVRREYVEDVRMYGLSFNTTINNASVFGEISYRPNLPIAISATNDLVGDLLAQGVAGTSGLYDANLGGAQACASLGGKPFCRGGVYSNYERVESINASLGTIYNFGPSLGFNSLVGIAEIATQSYHGSDLSYTGYNPTPVKRKFAGTPDTTDNPMTREAYGYTLSMQGTWTNVYAGVNLSPFFVHTNNFKGNSDLTGSFMEGRKGYTFGIKADYLSRFEAGLQYTLFTGAGQSNLIRDRDNVSMDVKYSF
ncbi:DUF1302 domain-containing protein [Pseudomonas juntendi]|uniref:DUF1302 domain-containing protein n=1 Tax=Pseudomonas juntendi TaxID=2666183 RepID=A0ABD4Y9U6_9PSED|nr:MULTISPECIES: DUF1302 domain-containing protein [Pseudomonas]MDH0756251.1 DUF1302 domain-containing protein [Pseudomonas juntendi]MDH1919970.1 DUF1302 domain-containing protein [Pseudomonas juntendi]